MSKNEKRNLVMNKNDQQFIAQKIRAQYMEKESSELDELRLLDAKVKKPANLFAYLFGSFSAIVMGGGMSLVMTDVGSYVGMETPMIPGIIIGVIGMALAIVNYPIYKSILNSRRSKYSAEILALSEKIIKD